MNLPIGEVISRGVNLKEIDVIRLISGLVKKKFSGYIVATLEGVKGLEEGILIFKSGVLTAAFYEYSLFGITVFGDSALPHVFNSFAGEYLIGDIVSLSNQQADLVTAFHDKAKVEGVVSEKEISRLIPRVFSEKFSQSVLNKVVESKETKDDVFKKLGLSKLGA